MIFSAMKQVNDDSFIGDKVLTMAEHGICCYAMHTNYDIAGGMAEICGAKMGLVNPEPFEVMGEMEDRLVGIGQVGCLSEKMTLAQCAAKVKEAFGLSNVLVFGDLDQIVEYAAVSPGSGRSMIKEADKKKVDVLITGDIGHHEGLDSMDMGFAVIEAGHYGLEQVFISHLCEYIEEKADSVEAVPFFEGMPYQVL
jgi:dinuclear metal center YbgI/SA1388 family protein